MGKGMRYYIEKIFPAAFAAGFAVTSTLMLFAKIQAPPTGLQISCKKAFAVPSPARSGREP